MLWNPGAWSATVCPAAIAQMAIAMNPRIVATLIAANQNSASPNILTLSMLRMKTRARATSAMIHWGMPWNAVQ